MNCLRRVNESTRVHSEWGVTDTPGLEYACVWTLCMLPQHCAIRLQTDCVVVVPAPW